jgi:hypothetical protein
MGALPNSQYKGILNFIITVCRDYLTATSAVGSLPPLAATTSSSHPIIGSAASSSSHPVGSDTIV